MKEKILIICVDRDNDLKKVKKSGPIIGRNENIEAAKSLLLYDPEDTDGNAILLAVKTYDEISKEKDKEVQIVTLTGHEELGYKADKNVAKQLEKVLEQFNAINCIFVSDGADDDSIIPIITSRLRIISKKSLTMKQAKVLESTWVLLLNKLKEPYYARIFLGVPGFLILLFVLFEYFGLGIKPVMALLGIYLIIKAFGIEEVVISNVKNILLPFSFSSITYVIAFILVLIGVIGGVMKFYSGVEALESGADAIRFFMIFLTISILIISIGKIFDLYSRKNYFELINSVQGVVNLILIFVIFYSALSWVYGDFWFSQFVVYTIGCFIFSLVFFEGVKRVKNNFIAGLRLENKEVINELGAYVGKVVGVDKEKNRIFVDTPLGARIQVDFSSILSIEEKIVIK